MLGDVAMNIMIIKTNTDDMDGHKYDGLTPEFHPTKFIDPGL